MVADRRRHARSWRSRSASGSAAIVHASDTSDGRSTSRRWVIVVQRRSRFRSASCRGRTSGCSSRGSSRPGSSPTCSGWPTIRSRGARRVQPADPDRELLVAVRGDPRLCPPGERSPIALRWFVAATRPARSLALWGGVVDASSLGDVVVTVVVVRAHRRRCSRVIPILGWRMIDDVEARCSARTCPRRSDARRYSSDARSRPSASSRSSCSCIQTVWYESMRGDVSHSCSPSSTRSRAVAQARPVAREPRHVLRRSCAGSAPTRSSIGDEPVDRPTSRRSGPVVVR